MLIASPTDHQQVVLLFGVTVERRTTTPGQSHLDGTVWDFALGRSNLDLTACVYDAWARYPLKPPSFRAGIVHFASDHSTTTLGAIPMVRNQSSLSRKTALSLSFLRNSPMPVHKNPPLESAIPKLLGRTAPLREGMFSEMFVYNLLHLISFSVLYAAQFPFDVFLRRTILLFQHLALGGAEVQVRERMLVYRE